MDTELSEHSLQLICELNDWRVYVGQAFQRIIVVLCSFAHSLGEDPEGAGSHSVQPKMHLFPAHNSKSLLGPRIF